MIIHRANEGQTVAQIARLYGVDEDILRMNNGLYDEPAVGEELLVLMPTRTYVVCRGDSAERLALRFGVMRRDLLALNPRIETEGLQPGRRIALKYGERRFGSRALCGYFYNGTDLSLLRTRLPYLTYVAIAAATFEDGRLRRSFDGRDAVGIIRMADRIPLLRIFSKGYGDLGEKASGELCEGLIYAAVSGGYKGIVLAGELPSEELLLRIKRGLMGSDLILLSEITPDSPEYTVDISDATLLGRTDMLDRAALESFALSRESNRCLPEIFPFARCQSGFVTIDEALRIARRGGCAIERTEEGACRFNHKRHGEFTFPSLENIKAIFEAVHEYGYMGLSYDIMRTPISHLMMLGAHFGVCG